MLGPTCEMDPHDMLPSGCLSSNRGTWGMSTRLSINHIIKSFVTRALLRLERTMNLLCH